MFCEWDEGKNQSNIRKHGVDFWDAIEIFKGDYLERIDPRSYDEIKWQAIGIARGEIFFVVYVARYEDTYRIISARKAGKNEKAAYYKHLFGR